MSSCCSTFVQAVQSGDVILAHLGGRAKFNICVGDRRHRGLIVAGEGIPAITKSAEAELFNGLYKKMYYHLNKITQCYNVVITLLYIFV